MSSYDICNLNINTIHYVLFFQTFLRNYLLVVIDFIYFF